MSRWHFVVLLTEFHVTTKT